MTTEDALSAISKYREALREGASNPSFISENTYKLAQYIAVVEDALAELERDLEVMESESFNNHIYEGKSANAAKELVRREFVDERAEVARLSRITTSGWKLVNSSQSRIRHLIAEANNQI